MKNSLILLLIFLLLAPPIRAHNDILVDGDVTAHFEEELPESNAIHHDKHHQNESEEQQNTEHHHHCVDFSFSPTFIQLESLIVFNNNFKVKKTIVFYQEKRISGYLNRLFQPPKQS